MQSRALMLQEPKETPRESRPPRPGGGAGAVWVGAKTPRPTPRTPIISPRSTPRSPRFSARATQESTSWDCSYVCAEPAASNGGTLGELDDLAHGVESITYFFDVERSDSMDMQNDPRFFEKSVMDKRLGAFKSLVIVSTLMFGTSMDMCFISKKDFNFTEYHPLVGYIAYWEFGAYLLSFTVAAMCMISMYIICHQLFLCVRLKTAGPMGFELATMFYLTRVIVVWRHLAMDFLFNGLWLFSLEVGIEFFITFFKDADDVKAGPRTVWFTNIVDGTSQNANNVNVDHSHKLDMRIHTVLGYFILMLFGIVSLTMYFIRKHHMTVFQVNYNHSKLITAPTTDRVLNMGSRLGTATRV